MNPPSSPVLRTGRTRSLSLSGERFAPYRPLTSNQCLYRHTGSGIWEPLPVSSLYSGESITGQAIPSFKIITWNIEFSSPLIRERTTGILDYIQTCARLSDTQDTGVPTILLFQEVHAKAFEAILCHPFIQNHYDLTDVSTRNFLSHYGTTTCVPRSLTPFLSAINRIPFENSQMGRDVLILDFHLPHFPKSRHSFPTRSYTSHIRVCNTHLESLRGRSDLVRPRQLKLISQLFLSVDGGIVAGDMNALAPTDDQVPLTLGLIDVWEVMHPQGMAEAGYTWGYQPTSRYPPGRLDKVFITGRVAPVSIGRFGVGQSIGYLRNDVWLSDHYGLATQFTLG